MKTLYINIDGENIQSNADLIVVGRPEDALINAFYYELGNEILNGVSSVAKISKRDLVLEFKNHDKDCFDKILDQWAALKKIVLGPNPSGQFDVELPDDYVKWLKDKSDRVYRTIAMSLVNRGRKVNISIDNIYEAIELLLDSIDPDDCSDCEQFVINDELITKESRIVIDMQESFGEQIDFKSHKNWKDEEPFTKREQFGKYDEIYNFHEGRACVRRNGKYGYIDIFGKEVVECKYDFADPFQEGLALVKEEDKYKFIDMGGRVAFEVDGNLEFYGDKCGFSEGLCKVGNKIDEDCDYDSPKKFGFIDRTGRLVIGCQFENASNFHSGRALVWDDGDDDYENRYVNFRYIDKDGNVVIESFDSATEFRNGYAAVQIKTLPKRHGNYKTRIIDVEGRNVYKLDMHDSLWGNIFSDMWYNYGLNNNVFRYSYREWIDLDTGKKYAYSYNGFSLSNCGFFEGLAAIKDRQGKWGFINIAGDIVINCQFNSDSDPMFSNGLACVEQNGLWGYIDKEGKVVIPFQYTVARNFSENRAVVRKDNTLMVIDTEGNQVF